MKPPPALQLDVLEKALDDAASAGMKKFVMSRPPPRNLGEVLQVNHPQYFREETAFMLYGIAEQARTEMEALVCASEVGGAPSWGYDDSIVPSTAAYDLRQNLVTQYMPIFDTRAAEYSRRYAFLVAQLQVVGLRADHAAMIAADQVGNLASIFFGPVGTFLTSLAAGSYAAQAATHSMQQVVMAAEAELQSVYTGMAETSNASVAYSIGFIRDYRRRLCEFCVRST